MSFRQSISSWFHSSTAKAAAAVSEWPVLPSTSSSGKPKIVIVGSGWAGYHSFFFSSSRVLFFLAVVLLSYLIPFLLLSFLWSVSILFLFFRYTAALHANKRKFDVTVISPRNHFLFTPLLPGVAVCSLFLLLHSFSSCVLILFGGRLEPWSQWQLPNPFGESKAFHIFRESSIQCLMWRISCSWKTQMIRKLAFQYHTTILYAIFLVLVFFSFFACIPSLDFGSWRCVWALILIACFMTHFLYRSLLHHFAFIGFFPLHGFFRSPTTFKIAGAQDFALFLRQVADAQLIRQRLHHCLERESSFRLALRVTHRGLFLPLCLVSISVSPRCERSTFELKRTASITQFRCCWRRANFLWICRRASCKFKESESTW